MKRFLIPQFILLLTYNLYAQETKLVTVKEKSNLKATRELNISKDKSTFISSPNGKFIEEYFVLKSDEKIRHGSYVKYRQPFWGIQILESGSYQNGQKNGVWEYYHDVPLRNTYNSIREKGYYVNDKKNGVWASYYIDTIPEITNQEKFGSKRKTDSTSIAINQQSARLMIAGMYLNDKRVGEWTSFAYSGDAFQKFDFSKQKLIFDRSMKDTLEYNKNRRSLFIGGLPCLMEFLSREFQLAGNIIKTERDSISVIVSFTIDKKGNLLDPKVEKSHGHKPLDDEAVRVTSRTNNHWIPAISDSKTIDSIYKIQFYIIRKNTSFTQKAFTINYKPIFE